MLHESTLRFPFSLGKDWLQRFSLEENYAGCALTGTTHSSISNIRRTYRHWNLHLHLPNFPSSHYCADKRQGSKLKSSPTFQI